MSHVDFFQPQIDCLSHFTFGQILADEKRGFTIDVLSKEKDKQNLRFGFDDLFQIRNKIRANLAELRATNATENVKGQLEVLKGKLVTKINKDRGWFKSMSGDEANLLNAYFAEMNAILDYKPGVVRRFLGGAFKVGVVGALAYGAYRYFGQ